MIYDDLLTHIEASAPCSLFSVAAWGETHFNMPATVFASAMEYLVSINKIKIEVETAYGGNACLVVDLI